MKKSGVVEGERITLKAVSNSEHAGAVQATWWLKEGHVKALTLVFPMSSYQAANNFVYAANESTFQRALDKLKAELDMVEMMNSALSRPVDQKKVERGLVARR